MRETLENICRQFIENRDIVKGAFNFESAYMHPICAAIFTQKNVKADAFLMKECQKKLKEKTGAFSNFRGNSKIAVISMMATAKDPDKRLESAMTVYEMLRGHFFGSEYLPLASMVISDNADVEKYAEICERTRRIYDLFKSEHPFLTSAEDVVFASILALSDAYERDIVIETERCYEILKENFGATNATQSLSHVLALFNGKSQDKCKETVDFYNELRQKGCKYGVQYELASLGVLAMQRRTNENIISDLLDAEAFLSTCSGYRGIFGFTKKTRLMHASIILSCESTSEQAVMNAATLGSTVSMIIAQQAAMCAAIAATTAASSSSN